MFYPCRLQSFNKVKESVIKDFLFTDYCPLSDGTEPVMSVGGLRRHIESVGGLRRHIESLSNYNTKLIPNPNKHLV